MQLVSRYAVDERLSRLLRGRDGWVGADARESRAGDENQGGAIVYVEFT
jgi:hypothetical protein